MNNSNELNAIIKRLLKFPTPHEERLSDLINFEDIAEKLSQLSPSLQQEAAAAFVKALKKHGLVK